jgi:hypothetical protein
MSDEKTKWFAGWYATRLHCVSVANLGGIDNAGRAVCGAWCYEKPKTEYAARLLAKGVPRCKHCERLHGQLSGARQQGETGQPVLTGAEREALELCIASSARDVRYDIVAAARAAVARLGGRP